MANIDAVQEVSYHRNGISGEGFYACRFSATTERGSEQFLGIVFDGDGQCAVISVDRLAKDGVQFGRNSWRGDNYEPELRAAIASMDSSGSVRVGPFGIPV